MTLYIANISIPIPYRFLLTDTWSRNIPNKVNKILLRVSLTLNKFSDALNIYYSTSQTPPAASIASFAEDENL